MLGAAAFLIAEFLKIGYLDVIWMATIPTCLYYLSLLFMVELDAMRFGAHEVVFKPEMTIWEMTKRYGFHFVSLIAVVVFMVIGYSPMLSVFYSTVLAFVMSALAPETALGPRKMLHAACCVRRCRRRRCCSRFRRSARRAVGRAVQSLISRC